MRYAHIYRSQMAGGMEHYLRPLDRALLTRAQDVLNEEREFVVRDFSMAALIERHEQFYDELRRQSPPKQLPASSRRQSSEY